MSIRTALASSSRVRLPASIPALARTYAVSGNPNDAPPGDARLDTLRSVLYPPNSVAPTSASPVGARHPKHADRIAAVLPSVEAHETVERAWALYRRNKREAAQRALAAKYAAMAEACSELDVITNEASGSVNRAVYDRAMVRMAHGAAANIAAAQGLAQGKKKTPESKWKESRPEGVVPREAWVPVETRGKGWNYGWERPPNHHE